jgi:hypothetical protein
MATPLNPHSFGKRAPKQKRQLNARGDFPMYDLLFSKTRTSFLAAVAILSATAIGLVIATTQLSSGAGLAPAADTAAPRSFAAACAKADLELIISMERYENTELNASPLLVDSATLLQFARTICATGSVRDALTVYRTAIRQLDTTYAELERIRNILKIARPDR